MYPESVRKCKIQIKKQFLSGSVGAEMKSFCKNKKYGENGSEHFTNIKVKVIAQI